ncbi:MAG: glycosyltransferase family 2 protein [Oscillospiraceae bacterium]|nr:glycosyltransferase family 2 protein [Oscillospiraceae bacterium]
MKPFYEGSMQQSNISILLAAYNGERYLRPMIDSILSQDYMGFRLILSDDGSTDKTAEILDEYANNHQDQVFRYHSGRKFGSAQKHFMHLLSVFHDSPYIMFCDQDDVWFPDKVRKTLQIIKETERDPRTPVLVHSDLRVVDQDLREIAPSFCRLSNLDGNRLALNQLLVQNVVTGCTMMINRALAELACREAPDGAILMHDWWLAMLAAACGKAAFLDEPTINYRQHGGNAVGASGHSPAELFQKFCRWKENRTRIFRSMRQAGQLAACYADILPTEALSLLNAYTALPEKSKSERLAFYRAHDTYYTGTARKMGQIIWG